MVQDFSEIISVPLKKTLLAPLSPFSGVCAEIIWSDKDVANSGSPLCLFQGLHFLL